MGFFSWKTQDTNRSIPNVYSNEKTFPVIMTDDKGNKYHEDSYQGYGDFGGKDYFELLAEINSLGTTRDAYFDAFSKISKEKSYEAAEAWSESLIHPSISECGAWYGGKAPEDCEYQGYFYPDKLKETFKI